MVKKNKSLLKLNQLLALCITLWVCIPWFAQNTGLVFGYALVLSWIGTAWVYNGMHLLIDKDTIAMSFWVFISLLSYVAFGHIYGDTDAVYFVSMTILFFLPYYMFKFYAAQKQYDFLALTAIFALVGMIIGAVISIYYSRIFPGIMKSVTQSANVEADKYRKSGIGGFGFVYMVMFCVIAVFSILKKIRKPWFWIGVLFGVIGVVCLVESTYTTSVIFLIVGLLLVQVSKTKSKSLRHFMYIGLPLAVLLISTLLGEFLSNITVASQGMTARLNEIGKFLLDGDAGYNLDGRFDRLKKSWECFIHYPILGYNFAENPNYVIGTHSEWIDILAIYGLVGSLPLYATLIFKLKHVNMFIKKESKSNAYVAILLVLVLYGFVDPILRIYHTGMAIFLIVPGIFCLPELKKRGKLNENTLGR